MPRGIPKNKLRKDELEHRTSFLQALTAWGTDAKALKVSEISRTTLYRWKQDPDFLTEYTQCKKDFGENIEHKAYQLVLHMLTPEVIDKKVEYNKDARYFQTLTMFVLNGMFPEKYKDHKGAEQEASDVMKTFRQAIKEAKKPTEKQTNEKKQEDFDISDILRKE
tara:strand:+ start:3393 stop:3887 length:495 start_codon:yes stop_codon:yes gene_type:complete